MSAIHALEADIVRLNEREAVKSSKFSQRAVRQKRYNWKSYHSRSAPTIALLIAAVGLRRGR